MVVPDGHATTRSARDALAPGADLPIARVVAVLLILLAIGAWFAITNLVKAGPSQPTADLANFNPRSVFSDTTPHFLPPPVAAIPAESNAGPPAPTAAEQSPADTPAVEQVRVANTGGVGAILRADPPKGHQVGALREGTLLQVLEHRQVDDGTEWLRVKTPDGLEGWLFSRLVAPSQ
ncbi:MAG: SH3 domain-containing protein [Chloroflexota bacterium]|nr:SH3 domain-containing protein [Chloroflexota bacterium]